MALALLLALQTVANPAPTPMARIDFDLDRVEAFDPADFRLQLQIDHCAAGEEDEIVVCGRRDEAERYLPGPLLPDRPTAMEEIGDGLSASLGPLDLGSFRRADGTRGFGLRMKF